MWTGAVLGFSIGTSILRMASKSTTSPGFRRLHQKLKSIASLNND